MKMFRTALIGASALLAIGMAFLAVPAPAQTTSATVVAACGTPPATYPAGSNRATTQDTNGNFCTNGTFTGTATVTGTVSNASSGVATSSTNLGTVNWGYAYNGSTWDQILNDPFKDVRVGLYDATTGSAVSLVTGTSGTPAGGVASVQGAGSADYPVAVLPKPENNSAYGIGGANGVVIGAAVSSISRGAPSNFYDGYVTTGGTGGFLMLINATSLPSNGAITAGTASGNLLECIQAPANSTVELAYTLFPEVVSVGATLAFSTTGCASLTAGTPLFLHLRSR